ncbi:M20/M25/M40 family metallo-hydrolase [Sphingomonas canadensis]|uniref:M20/M25/M40 family metallo-hydrolase n=1 Tax=Sphingomonas canadensis TaxID=1219257 RepID=A0ABW3H844_9SPHN|nr:M20/M25/M40 family metallo-hydrolase [Sphingomonas canadensis]MCW3837189.1 M20/M25/M40 family metallo-hydrolase [Sphingomonas canadensis]
MLRYLSLILLLLAAPLAHAQQLPPEQAAMKAHIQFLASDAMRGRDTGSREFDIAAEYVAAQFLALGLKPAGVDGDWFQPFRMVSVRPQGRGTMVMTRRGAEPAPLVFGTDFVNDAIPSALQFAASGDVVFAGYGIVYPEGKRDDYKGLNVKDKIVAILPGTPKGLPNEVSAHLGDEAQKAIFAQERGARAVIVLESAARHDDLPFATFVRFYDYPRSTWAGPDGKAHSPSPGAPVAAYVSQAGAEKLFAGARIKWADVLAAEAKGTRMPTGPLAATLTLASKTSVVPTPSKNVIGMIEGSDPALKGQYLVLTAHLDHVGVGDAVNGDRIYNGAMDNASGVAALIEVARAFRASGKAPRRSILFIALGAEEKGLIGSDYFAHNPTVPRAALIGNLNFDMPILTYKVEDLVMSGGERSTISQAVAKAAAAEGLAIVPDPTPEEMFFVRSDHYSFVKAGVPAVSIDTGPGGAGAEAQKLFLANDYHKPSDQITLPFDWASVATYVRVVYGASRIVADANDRPRWVKGDFFGVQFDGYGAK